MQWFGDQNELFVADCGDSVDGELRFHPNAFDGEIRSYRNPSNSYIQNALGNNMPIRRGGAGVTYSPPKTLCECIRLVDCTWEQSLRYSGRKFCKNSPKVDLVPGPRYSHLASYLSG